MAPSEFPTLNSDIQTKWFQSLDTDEALRTATRTCTHPISRDHRCDHPICLCMCLEPRRTRHQNPAEWTTDGMQMQMRTHRRIIAILAAVYTWLPSTWFTPGASHCRCGHGCTRLPTKPSTPTGNVP
jgi:hypothetical protein